MMPIKRFLPITQRVMTIDHLSDQRVYALLEDKQNNLWIGTNGGGINVLDLSTQKITKYKNEPNNVNSLSNDDIRCFYEDRNGDIWVGRIIAE